MCGVFTISTWSQTCSSAQKETPSPSGSWAPPPAPGNLSLLSVSADRRLCSRCIPGEVCQLGTLHPFSRPSHIPPRGWSAFCVHVPPCVDIRVTPTFGCDESALITSVCSDGVRVPVLVGLLSRVSILWLASGENAVSSHRRGSSPRSPGTGGGAVTDV